MRRVGALGTQDLRPTPQDTGDPRDKRRGMKDKCFRGCREPFVRSIIRPLAQYLMVILAIAFNMTTPKSFSEKKNIYIYIYIYIHIKP